MSPLSHQPPTARSSPRPVTVEERLFSFVLALIATEIGLTKAEILETVQGYRQRYSASASNASLERQFERDKDDIRELGIPLEMVEPADDPGSNHNLRYRIPKGLYNLPADVTFSPNEVMLLRLAATVWREGSLSAESRRALTKLNSLGLESGDPLLGYAPSLRARESSFEPLSKAMDRNHVVSFLYLKPGDTTPQPRRVAPRAIVLHDGRWHLFATDQVAAAPRTFLLSRIVGPVLPVPGSADTAVPTASGAHPGQDALAELDTLWNAQTATLSVRAFSDAAIRLSKRDTSLLEGSTPMQTSGGPSVDAVVITLHYSDLNIFADELAGYGPEVLVHSPPLLRAAVRTRLLGVARAHGGTA
ncbi:WYL domain-containing protein [Cryobacterium sp. CG_9.6]|uniref:helix-turn-helix transcriptional regulator n=1 Tax=Cryobacterium sp. CG_9.6 TaxID=2760710 RepID=UPI00247433A7|nr:WYL domain-containing protein [Cryobacterium sp. CG_9.6]MDH6236985.1 proteasome accessory factor B [Cryobacterium sp. CG_9.6]